MRAPFISIATLIVGLLSLCGTVVFSAAEAAEPATISGRTIAGNSFDVKNDTGRVVIVNFWATWCLPCRSEMPALDSYYQAHHAAGIEMVAISMDDPSKAQTVRSVAAAFHFPVALARDVRIPGAYRPSQLPVTLVFGRDGRLRFDSRRTPGLMTQAQLDRIAGPLLAEAGR